MTDASPDRKMRILFVDDEPRVIQGLRRLLHRHRDRWEMIFVTAPADAVALIGNESFDVVVSDMRMPEMNGAELLRQVMKISPQTIRIILSGQSEASSIMESVGPSHQFLSKPCDPEVLESCILRAQKLRAQLENPTLLGIIGKLESIPTLPSLYAELVDALDRERPIAEIGEIVGRDIGMTIRILQLVNSSYFGIARRIESPAQGVSILGTETFQSLVLATKVFEAFEGGERAFIDQVARHSERTAVYARAICQHEKAGSVVTNQAVLAAFLHDLGWMALATASPDLLNQLRTENILLSCDDAVERQVLGTTHGEIGAYLLGIWGIPDQIVETVAWHSAPRLSQVPEFGPLAIVHFAQVCARVNLSDVECVEDLGEQGLDLLYLEAAGLLDSAGHWLERCAAVPLEENARG